MNRLARKPDLGGLRKPLQKPGVSRVNQDQRRIEQPEKEKETTGSSQVGSSSAHGGSEKGSESQIAVDEAEKE